LLSDGSFNYTYDDEGNLLTKTDIATSEVTQYTWDYRNRLTNVTVKDSSQNVIQESDYTYDAFDKRIGVEVDPDGDGQESATQRWTAYDGANPYADFDGSGNLTQRYLYGPAADMILARMDSAEDVAWYLTDHLGSVRDLADPGGNVIDHITYDSFGSVLSESVPAEGDRFKYTGREYDAETGLYYYRARYYDPGMGRFISEDPIGFKAGDANIYRYVGNAATVATDPTGLAADNPWWDVGSPVEGSYIRTFLVKMGTMTRRTDYADGSWLIEEADRFVEVTVYERVQTQRRINPTYEALMETWYTESAKAEAYKFDARCARIRQAAYLYMAGRCPRADVATLLIAAAAECERRAQASEDLADQAQRAADQARDDLNRMGGNMYDERTVVNGELQRAGRVLAGPWRFKEYGWRAPSGGGSDGGGSGGQRSGGGESSGGW
jgi:RHS repeat-associated protein